MPPAQEAARSRPGKQPGPPPRVLRPSPRSIRAQGARRLQGAIPTYNASAAQSAGTHWPHRPAEQLSKPTASSPAASTAQARPRPARPRPGACRRSGPGLGAAARSGLHIRDVSSEASEKACSRKSNLSFPGERRLTASCSVLLTTKSCRQLASSAAP